MAQQHLSLYSQRQDLHDSTLTLPYTLINFHTLTHTCGHRCIHSHTCTDTSTHVHTHMFTHISSETIPYTLIQPYTEAHRGIDLCAHKLRWADRCRPKSIPLTFLGDTSPGWEQLKGCPRNTCPEWSPGPTQLCSSTHRPNQVSKLDSAREQCPVASVYRWGWELYQVRLEEARDGKKQRRHPQDKIGGGGAGEGTHKAMGPSGKECIFVLGVTPAHQVLRQISCPYQYLLSRVLCTLV